MKMADNKQSQSNVISDNKGANVNINTSTPILYTDAVYLTSNKYGIVFNIAQSVGPTNQQEVVARIGMSREHAKDLLEVLGKHLAITTSSNIKQ